MKFSQLVAKMQLIFSNSADIQIAEKRVLKNGSSTRITLKVRFGFIDHPQFGPTLIDTGYGVRSLAVDDRSPALRIYALLIKPKLTSENPVSDLLCKFGYEPKDVQTIIVTHFHADHISELSQFENAQFLLDARSWRQLCTRSPISLVATGIFKELLPRDFEQRMRPIHNCMAIKTPIFDEAYDLFGDGQCCAVALPGHADGHFGLLFPQLEIPLLYAVDVEWVEQAILEDRPPGFPASFVQQSKHDADNTRALVRRFIDRGGEILLCHDPKPHHFDLKTGGA